MHKEIQQSSRPNQEVNLKKPFFSHFVRFSEVTRGQKLFRFHSQSDNNPFDCYFRRSYFEGSIFQLIVLLNDSAYLIARKKKLCQTAETLTINISAW